MDDTRGRITRRPTYAELAETWHAISAAYGEAGLAAQLCGVLTTSTFTAMLDGVGWTVAQWNAVVDERRGGR